MQDPEARRTSVEYVEQPCKSALNPVRGMPFRWSLNPYMGCEHRCTFCYVRAFEKRADRPADDRYGRTVRVKTNIAAVLRAELGRPSWRGEAIVLGAATDPYQPAEGTYRLTRACLQVLAARANPAGLITRGPMIVRDIDVLQDLSRTGGFEVTFSVPTLDDDVWRRTEPGTAHPRRRLEAISRLVRAGIRASVGMAPILPGLSDRPEQIEAVVRAAREAGAVSIWASLLYLRPGTREHFMASVARHWPELLPRYAEEYAQGAYLPRSKTQPIQELVRSLRLEYGIADRRANPIHAAERPRQLLLI
ncbi:MAG: Rv2578c family radical SAM protein [Candidatus Dormibacteraceae bacterium]